VDYHLLVAVVADDQKTFGQIELQVLTAVDGTAQIGFARFELVGQINLRVFAAVGAFVCFQHAL
jgi:hypothetical protein